MSNLSDREQRHAMVLVDCIIRFCGLPEYASIAALERACGRLREVRVTLPDGPDRDIILAALRVLNREIHDRANAVNNLKETLK